MTAAERLLQLAGTTGTAAALLLSIGTGATTGEALADYSGLTGAQAQEHLLVERSHGAGYYDTKKRKKNIVNVDGVLYEFATEREAIAFLNTLDVTKKQEKPKEVSKPIRKVRISEVQTLSKVFANPVQERAINKDIQFADYQMVLRAYDQWLERDEEEALLLLM